MKTPDQPAHPLTRDHTLLNAARAEITLLRDENKLLRAEVELDEDLQVATESSLKTAIARAEKAEAEVERLKEQLRIESSAAAHALHWAEKAEAGY
jgi:hypothetical protein